MKILILLVVITLTGCIRRCPEYVILPSPYLSSIPDFNQSYDMGFKDGYNMAKKEIK